MSATIRLSLWLPAIALVGPLQATPTPTPSTRPSPSSGFTFPTEISSCCDNYGQGMPRGDECYSVETGACVVADSSTGCVTQNGYAQYYTRNGGSLGGVLAAHYISYAMSAGCGTDTCTVTVNGDSGSSGVCAQVTCDPLGKFITVADCSNLQDDTFFETTPQTIWIDNSDCNHYFKIKEVGNMCEDPSSTFSPTETATLVSEIPTTSVTPAPSPPLPTPTTLASDIPNSQTTPAPSIASSHPTTTATPAPAPTSAPTNGSTPCFSKVATVQVLGIGSVAMKDLKLGDFVMTRGKSFQPVYAFGHKNHVREAAFLAIHSAGQRSPLEITASHMLFIVGKSRPVRADSIKVGDVLMKGGASSGGKSSNAEGATVIKVGTVTRKGIFAPLTLGGSVVVDDVVASCYTSLTTKKKADDSFVSHHQMIHIGLSPYRLVCNGLSPWFCSESFNNADGMPYFVEFGLALYQWALLEGGNAFFVRGLVLSSILMVTGTFYVFETLFGKWALLVLAAMCYYCTKKSRTKTLGYCNGKKEKNR